MLICLGLAALLQTLGIHWDRDGSNRDYAIEMNTFCGCLSNKCYNIKTKTLILVLCRSLSNYDFTYITSQKNTGAQRDQTTHACIQT